MNPHIRHLFILVLLWCGACAASKNAPVYTTIPANPTQDTDLARARYAEALQLLDKEAIVEAEGKLQEALAADLMFGPAHNALGKIYYQQKKLYLAAWEFEYAIKLMPHHAEPRNNLGLTLEAAGDFDQAVEKYATALQLAPENPQVIGNLARVHIRRGDRTDETRLLLDKLLLRDSRPEWAEWARETLATW